MENNTPQNREIAHWQKWQDKADEVWGWRTPAGQQRANRRARLFLELARMFFIVNAHHGDQVADDGTPWDLNCARCRSRLRQTVASALNDPVGHGRLQLSGPPFVEPLRFFRHGKRRLVLVLLQ